MKHFTNEERETIINMSDGDDDVRIWTAQRKVITALRRKTEFTEIESGWYGTSEWASFIIPARRFAMPNSRRTVSDARRAELSDAMRERHVSQATPLLTS